MINRVVELAEVQRLADEFINQEGVDFVYTPPATGIKCVYVHEDQASCLIGRILDRLGVPLEWLGNLSRNSRAVRNLWIELRDDFGLGFTPEAETFLSMLQQRQDQKATWGGARRAANKEVEHVYRRSS